jgi:DNA sulfur modification protein DndB
LSAIETATTVLLADQEVDTQERIAKAIEFWEAVGKNMDDWIFVRNRQASSAEIRKESIAAHGIALAALGHVGRALLQTDSETWTKRLAKLSKLDWKRSNASLWEGRALIGGRVHKAHANVRLTASLLKTHLKLPLTPEEVELEASRRSAS